MESEELREENRRLEAEVAALRSRLALYEGSARGASNVGEALAAMHGRYPLRSPSDWIALYRVLTTAADAPTAFTAFAAWAAAYASALGLPECRASLLYKADPVYQKPLCRWEEEAQRSSTLRRRLAMARCLKQLLS